MAVKLGVREDCQSGAVKKVEEPPPVWVQPISWSRVAGSPVVYRTVPPTPTANGLVDGYSADGMGPMSTPLSPITALQPEPASPVEAKNERPSTAALFSAAS
jgi:hypothetical protein